MYTVKRPHYISMHKTKWPYITFKALISLIIPNFSLQDQASSVYDFDNSSGANIHGLINSLNELEVIHYMSQKACLSETWLCMNYRSLLILVLRQYLFTQPIEKLKC